MKTFTATPEEFQTGEAASKAVDFFRNPNRLPGVPKKPRAKPAPYKPQDRQVGTITPKQFLQGDAVWMNKRRYGHRTFHDPAIKPMPESIVDTLLEDEDDVPDQYYYDQLRQDRLLKHTDKDVLRKVKAAGYTFVTWDTGSGDGNHNYIGYELIDPRGRTLFSGEDVGVPGQYAIDSDEATRSALHWLTLRPGDTDEEYFEKYTPQQLEWANGDGPQDLALYADDETPEPWDEDFEVGNWLPGSQEE